MQYTLGEIVRRTFPTVTENTPLPSTTHKNASGTIVETYDSGGPITTSQTSGSIVYTKSSKRFPKRSNFCAHNVSMLRLIGGIPSTWNANDLNPAHVGWTWQPWWDFAMSVNAHNAALPIALPLLGSTGLGKLQANWLNYAATGFQALQPDLTKLSLPNFLIDIEQVGGLVSDVKSVTGFIQRSNGKVPALQDLRKFAALPKTDKFKSAAKLVAEKRLSYKFGWTPTIGDVKAMLDSIISLDIRLQAFKQKIGQELSYTKTLENVNTWKVGQFNYGNDVHYQVNWAGYLNGKVQYHAKYEPQPLAVLGPLDETIRGYLDHFGVELNPQILWDAIPFSFVLDWFTGFGSWLGQFKIDALQLPILLIDSAVSYKEKYQVGSSVVINPNGYPTDVTATTKPAGFSTEHRFFHRMPVDPSVPIYRSLGWKNPTGSQWTNFVSLAAALAL
jgi:hypothetical protein